VRACVCVRAYLEKGGGLKGKKHYYSDCKYLKRAKEKKKVENNKKGTVRAR